MTVRIPYIQSRAEKSRVAWQKRRPNIVENSVSRYIDLYTPLYSQFYLNPVITICFTRSLYFNLIPTPRAQYSVLLWCRCVRMSLGLRGQDPLTSCGPNYSKFMSIQLFCSHRHFPKLRRIIYTFVALCQ